MIFVFLSNANFQAHLKNVIIHSALNRNYNFFSGLEKDHVADIFTKALRMDKLEKFQMSLDVMENKINILRGGARHCNVYLIK